MRLVLTPFVAYAVWTETFAFAVPFFLLVAATDMLDGSLARTRGQITDWGTLYDPVADKLLIGSVAAVLLYKHFPPTLAAIIIAIEGVFLAMGYYRKRQGRIVSANRWGKAKMLLQVIGVMTYMLALAFAAPWLAGLSYGILSLATVFALFSLYTSGA